MSDYLYIDIEPYVEDPVEWEVDKALKILSVGEDYDYYPSAMNHRTYPESGRKCLKNRR